MEEVVSAIYSMVKFVKCEVEKKDLIKIEVDTIFNNFNIGPNEELKRSVYLEEGFQVETFNKVLTNRNVLMIKILVKFLLKLLKESKERRFNYSSSFLLRWTYVNHV